MEDVENTYHSISRDVSSVGIKSVHLISPTDIDSGFKYEEEHKIFGSEVSVTESKFAALTIIYQMILYNAYVNVQMI